MTIARLKSTAVAVALLAAGSAQAVTLINEGFDNVAGLAAGGWSILNLGVFQGSTSFFQGGPTIFTSQAGAPDAYIAANFNNATSPGYLNTWLVTPQFSTANAGTISFWARGAIEPGFSDTIAYGLVNGLPGSGGSLAAPVTITAQGAWTQYTMNFAAAGAGTFARFAMVYIGNADTANYIGIDTLTVNSVPEPGTWLLMGAGMLGTAGLVRRRTVAA
jgi:PEP-CTERM motif